MNRSSRSLALVAGFATVVAGIALAPAQASAQRRAVARPASRSVVVVAARPYRPVYYAPFFSYGPYGYYGWYGWSPLYAQRYPYPYPAPYPHGRVYADYSSAVRLQVQPRHAEVFIDGHFVGTVDHFDGWAQRLRVAPGERELEIYLAGHRTFRRHVLFRPGATITIRHDMEPLGQGETAEGRPMPAPAAAPQQAGRPIPPARPGVPSRARPGEAREYGALEIRVQPGDAQVFVDGDRWDSPEPGLLTLDLADGVHKVEIRRDGFRTYSADVRVVGGEVTTVNVSLSRN